MSDYLTREEVEADAEIFVGPSLRERWLAHDAALRQQLAASEARCKIYEDGFNELQNAILDAQHILDKEN